MLLEFNNFQKSVRLVAQKADDFPRWCITCEHYNARRCSIQKKVVSPRHCCGDYSLSDATIEVRRRLDRLLNQKKVGPEVRPYPEKVLVSYRDQLMPKKLRPPIQSRPATKTREKTQQGRGKALSGKTKSAAAPVAEQGQSKALSGKTKSAAAPLVSPHPASSAQPTRKSTKVRVEHKPPAINSNEEKISLEDFYPYISAYLFVFFGSLLLLASRDQPLSEVIFGVAFFSIWGAWVLIVVIFILKKIRDFLVEYGAAILAVIGMVFLFLSFLGALFDGGSSGYHCTRYDC